MSTYVKFFQKFLLGLLKFGYSLSNSGRVIPKKNLRKKETMCVRERESVRESVRERDRERERERDRERESVSVREREREREAGVRNTV